MRILAIVVALAACSTQEPPPSEPDAGPPPMDAGPSYDRCERWNNADLDCRTRNCSGRDTRVCDVEKHCQEWDDCVNSDGEVNECYQCRHLYYCECLRAP